MLDPYGCYCCEGAGCESCDPHWTPPKPAPLPSRSERIQTLIADVRGDFNSCLSVINRAKGGDIPTQVDAARLVGRVLKAMPAKLERLDREVVLEAQHVRGIERRGGAA